MAQPQQNSKIPQLTPYQVKEIETASPEQLLLILYDGAIRFLNIAKQCYEEKDWEGYSQLLIRAQKIVREFMITLDTTIVPEVANNLYRLYDYLHYQLVQANIKREVTNIDEVLGHLRDLRATWAEAIKRAHQEGVTVGSQLSARHMPTPAGAYGASYENNSTSYSV